MPDDFTPTNPADLPPDPFKALMTPDVFPAGKAGDEEYVQPMFRAIMVAKMIGATQEREAIIELVEYAKFDAEVLALTNRNMTPEMVRGAQALADAVITALKLRGVRLSDDHQ